MYLRRLQIQDFLKPREDAATYPEMPNAYKVCCISTTEDPCDAAIVAWVKALTKQDRKVFRNGMGTILKVANSGRPLETHYDEKQCHDAHCFWHKGNQHTIWRIRQGDLRILFFYGTDHIILLIDAFPKHTDKLTKAQKLNAETITKSYLDAKKIQFTQEQKNDTHQDIET